MRHSSEPSPYKILPGMNEGRKAGFVHERKYPVPRATYIFYTPPCLPGAISQHSSSSHTETKNSRSTADAACRLLSPNGFPLFAPFVPAQTGIPDKPWILTGPCPGNSNIPHTASTLPPPHTRPDFHCRQGCPRRRDARCEDWRIGIAKARVAGVGGSGSKRVTA